MKRGIELIVGPMFCGKTSELLRRLKREEIAGLYVQLFKPVIDDRYSKNKVVSHDNISREAILVNNISDIQNKLKEKTLIIGIDEIQFFPEDIIGFCLDYSKSRLIIASGLALDFKDEPFQFRNSEIHIGELMPYCRIIQLTAICTYKDNKGRICGKEAGHNQRLINGKPAPYNGPLVLVGGKEHYEARCDKHYFIEKV